MLITMVIGSKAYFSGASSWVAKQADRLTQFAVPPDITVTGGPVPVASRPVHIAEETGATAGMFGN
ncbi:hypothetical protein [Burkholderia sp. MSMB1072]|uniref:hypothetical protein n=1 Tax=Burkholderia sp. MSMB1072 TaxID=1637871 RepID=UPI000A8C62A3|nr:hypothetical protein [Burkholderia sp. MSMB1072]